MIPHGIMLHHFYDKVHPAGQGAISATEFEDLLRFVGLERFLSAEEWMRRAQEGQLEEGNLCLTFDDGLRCQYDIALPVMRKLGLTAFWFVYTGPLAGQKDALEVYRYFRTVQFDSVDTFYNAFGHTCASLNFKEDIDRGLLGCEGKKYLSQFTFYSDGDRRFRYIRDMILGPERYAEVMEMMLSEYGFDVNHLRQKLWMSAQQVMELKSQGHVVGLHSHTHPTALSKMSNAMQKQEYTANLKHLEAILGSSPIVMSHPCNSYNDYTLSILKGMNICLGFRSNMAKSAKHSCLEFPRQDHAIILKMMGGGAFYV